MAIRTALAAVGRDPTDITLSTVGSQGSGSGGGSGSGRRSGSGGGGDMAGVATHGGGASGSGVLVAQGALSLPSGSGAGGSGTASNGAAAASTSGVIYTAGSTGPSDAATSIGAAIIGVTGIIGLGRAGRFPPARPGSIPTEALLTPESPSTPEATDHGGLGPAVAHRGGYNGALLACLVRGAGDPIVVVSCGREGSTWGRRS
jgi:hypothetical protein